MTNTTTTDPIGEATGAPAAVADEQAISPLAVLAVALNSTLNAALWQNHVPILTELCLTVGEQVALGDILIDLVCEPAVILPRTWRLQNVGVGQTRQVPDLDVSLDGNMLLELTEGTRATVVFSARRVGDDSVVVAETRCDLRVLPHNEWGGSVEIPDILAAFVESNDPAVAKILHLASDQLRAQGRADGLEGYQATTKARIWEQAEALWRAVCSLDIRYVNPPPSFERVGQRIRPPRQIFEERLGTCLDLATLFAACLEAIGLYPVIVVIREHAFAGFWLSRYDLGKSAADDAPALRTRLALHDLLLFETTMACGGGRAGFTKACELGADHVQPEKDEAFDVVIDIHRARQRRIRPLAARDAQYAWSTEVPEDTSAGAVMPVEAPPPLRDDPRDDVLEASPPTPAGRLEMWRRRLLDLSGRNRLLNLRTGGKQAVTVDCPDIDRLWIVLTDMYGQTGGAPLRFRPWPDLMTGADPRSAKLHRARMQEDAERAFAREAMERRELLVGRDEASLQAALTEIFRASRAAEQEGGSNTLFLTFGSLLWRQKDKEVPYRAPIVLVPVTLERPSVRSGFTLKAHGDETRLNATLLEMLKQDFDIRFPTLEIEHDGERQLNMREIVDAFRRKIRDIAGWEVVEEISLTNLSFTKYLMWKDLADRADALRESEIARRLIDGSPNDRSDEGASNDWDNRGETTFDLVCPLEGDSSQLRAAALAASGKSFVLIGPPGTGKSQTIANIVVDTLARGRTVLFVAEKRAALEVVQRRLREVHLDEFCLDLFSPKTSKAAVVEQLDRAQQAREAFDPILWTTAVDEIAALRSELNDYVVELHHRGRNGWTPFRAMGVVIRADDGAVPEIALTWAKADFHDAGDYQRLVEAVEEASATFVRVAGVVTAGELAGVEVAEWSPPWQNRLLEAARRATDRLEALPKAAAAAGKALGLPMLPLSVPVLVALDTLAGLLLDPLAAESGWALRTTAEEIVDAARAEAMRVKEYRRVYGTLSVTWRPTVTAMPLGDLREAWRNASGRWALSRHFGYRVVRGRLKSEAITSVPADCASELDRLIALQSMETALAAADAQLAPVLGRHWRGMETDFDRIEADYTWARSLRAAMAGLATDPADLVSLRTHVQRLIVDAPDLLASTGSVGSALQRFRTDWGEVQECLTALSDQCGRDAMGIIEPSNTDWVESLIVRLRGWEAGSRHLRDWCGWHGVAQRAGALGLSPILSAIVSGVVSPADARRVFEANYARWWVGLAIEVSPRLRAFVAAQHETRIERFRALDRRLLQLASRLARAKLAQASLERTFESVTRNMVC